MQRRGREKMGGPSTSIPVRTGLVFLVGRFGLSAPDLGKRIEEDGYE